MVDDFGDLLRETEFPFPNGKLTMTEVVLLDVDKVKEAGLFEQYCTTTETRRLNIKLNKQEKK